MSRKMEHAIALAVLHAVPRHTRKVAAGLLGLSVWRVHRLARQKLGGARLLSDNDVELLRGRRTRQNQPRKPKPAARRGRGRPVGVAALARRLKADFDEMIGEMAAREGGQADEGQGGEPAP